MKRLQSRMITVIVLGIVLATFLNGAVSLVSFISVGEQRSISILENELKLSASYINETFRDVEKFTDTLSDYYLRHCPDTSMLMHPEGIEYMDACKELATTLVKDNDILCATYFRLNTELAGPTGGFFLSATTDNHIVTEQPPTNIALYDKDDISHVGWYYEPIKAGKPIWMDEYFNENNGILMISYVAPLYLRDGTLLGVVGIDIDMTKVYNYFSGFRIYDTGIEAIMTKEGIIKNKANDIHITDEDKAKILGSETQMYFSYIDGRKEMTLMAEPLKNGDYLLLTIQNDDLYATENRIILTTIVITLFVIILVVMFLTKILHRILYKFKIDSLTKTENKIAYSDEIAEIDHIIRMGHPLELTVIVFDINGLKLMNDEAGHVIGNQLIENAADIIRTYFPDMTIYRIGGDEFVICSKHSAQNALFYRLKQFRKAMRERAKQGGITSETVIVSAGIAIYDAEKDHCYEDVFRRADKDMYNDKRRFYEENPDLDRRLK